MAALADRLRGGEALVTAWSGVPDALTVEILAQQGFDVVTLDMQHGGHHEDSVLRGLQAVRSAGRHSLVRIPVGRFDMASRALDFGAEGVIAPMINSVADAQSFAEAMKYPPVGQRSWGPGYAMPRNGVTDPKRWLREANGATLSIAMIETRAAYEALDGILAVPGIDAIFVGPSDFSIAWSGGGTIDPHDQSMMSAVADIARRAAAAGKPSAIYINDPVQTGRFRDMGFRLFAQGSEHSLIAQGARALLAAARGSL